MDQNISRTSHQQMLPVKSSIWWNFSCPPWTHLSVWDVES